MKGSLEGWGRAGARPFRIALWVAVVFALASWALPARASDIDEGKKLFEERRCGVCHAIAGKGGMVGPDLSGVGKRREREWILKFLKDPKGMIPDSKMPAVKATDEEFTSLAAYLLSLK